MGHGVYLPGLRHRLDVDHARRVTYRTAVETILRRFPIREAYLSYNFADAKLQDGCQLNRRRCNFRRKTRCVFRRFRVFLRVFRKEVSKDNPRFPLVSRFGRFRIASVCLKLICIATKWLVAMHWCRLQHSSLVGKKNGGKGVFLYTTSYIYNCTNHSI